MNSAVCQTRLHLNQFQPHHVSDHPVYVLFLEICCGNITSKYAEDDERLAGGELSRAAGADLDRRDHRPLLGDPRHDRHQLQGAQGAMSTKPCIQMEESIWRPDGCATLSVDCLVFVGQNVPHNPSTYCIMLSRSLPWK